MEVGAGVDVVSPRWWWVVGALGPERSVAYGTLRHLLVMRRSGAREYEYKVRFRLLALLLLLLCGFWS
ncbi:hypothetical protein HOY80DRAFT_973501 [Tuber brumale]|nr:hypothetical protein HOY80DRAFT_973501 [Tuber brumale]